MKDRREHQRIRVPERRILNALARALTGPHTLSGPGVRADFLASMERSPLAPLTTVLALAFGLAACTAPQRTAVAELPIDPNRRSPAELAREDGGKPPYTKADAAFMSGMIPHHAQAVLIAGWAATHGARSDIQVLCERIVVAQTDEITTMKSWLEERDEPVPSTTADHTGMAGMHHGTLMPGMLNADELASLNRARGAEFDRLFLVYMIRHHEGALTMVDALFNSPGAGQDEIVYKFASDVFADQSTEIERMERMLAAMPQPAR